MNPAARSPSRPDNLAEYRRRVGLVRKHIARHLDDPPDLAALAKIAHFSPFHFHRIFRGVTGVPLLAYIRALRLERAATELTSTEDSILTIALRARYDSHEAFTRAFRDHFGVTPTQLRRGQSARPATCSTASGVPPMHVRVVNVDPIPVASIRHVGPYGSPSIGETWNRLCQWAGQRGLLGPGTRCFGIGLDDPECTPPAQIRYDACVTVPGSARAEGEVQIQTIPGRRYATARHVGSYQHLAEVYGTLYGQALPAAGHEPADSPPFEEYVNNPRTTPPEQLITDIYIPIE